MQPFKQRRILETLLLTAFLCSCVGSDGGNDGTGNKGPNDDGDIDVDVTSLPLLAAGCNISAITPATLTVFVKDGESALLSLRPGDGVVTVNGNVFTTGATPTDTGVPCEVPTTTLIKILGEAGASGSTTGRTVILDYINGLFGLGTTVPGITIDFSAVPTDNGTKNSVKVRGSDGADWFAIGAGTGTGATAVYAFNANAKAGTPTMQVGGTGGVSVTLDSIVDVTMKNVLKPAMISSGAGDDRLDASGIMASGTGAAFPIAVQLFGGDGNDTINGGAGADTISGGGGADILSGCGGDDTYDMGSVASGADVIAQACMTTTALEGKDTLDYSKRSGVLTVTLSRALTPATAMADTALSGEAAGDGAHVSDKVTNIKLGNNNDIITIQPNTTPTTTPTFVHSIKGGQGHDTFNGGNFGDLFDGEAGDDTCISNFAAMDYRSRGASAPITATLCGTGCTVADANDGDATATGSTQTGTGATDSATGGQALAVFTATSGGAFVTGTIGNVVTLTNCTVPAANGAYPIVGWTSATVVKLNVSSNTGYALSGGCTWTEARGATPVTGAGGIAASTVSPSVGGLRNTAKMLYHTITLTGGDAGSYLVVGVVDATTVAVDVNPLGSFGGKTDLGWSEAGPEKDNIQCPHVFGGAGSDNITGDGRNNNITGGAGVDTLNGGTGSDNLIGEAGADLLYGGGGDDTLVGGADADTLTGGDQNDLVQGDADVDIILCDGKNSSTAMSAGTSPGDADITVDLLSGEGGADCEF